MFEKDTIHTTGGGQGDQLLIIIQLLRNFPTSPDYRDFPKLPRLIMLCQHCPELLGFFIVIRLAKYFPDYPDFFTFPTSSVLFYFL